MRVRHKPWAGEKLAQHPEYVITEPISFKGKWQESFGNDAPIHIEVGSGKGQFIVGMAAQNPDINYIGIELQTSVAVTALDKMLEAGLPNVKLLNTDGGLLSDYFEDGEIDRVYLNFSDPWPKARHEKRRLTYKSFLENYRTILKPNGAVHFKTDNMGLFEYSLGSFSQFGMVIDKVWLDLHASDFEGNIQTEYEQKFSAKGQPIYRVEAHFLAE